MRVWFIVASGILVWATGTALAQDPSVLPTRVNEEGIYACPNHPDILATWPARCPTCQTVLSPVPSAAVTSAETIPVAAQNRYPRDEDREDRERRERFQDEARRRREFGYRYYRPYPYGYVYPPRFYGRLPFGYQYYPNFGYYYNPNIGLYYYPNMGYFYSPYTGRYYYYSPGQGYFYFQFPLG
jgi:hypothetical protein